MPLGGRTLSNLRCILGTHTSWWDRNIEWRYSHVNLISGRRQKYWWPTSNGPVPLTTAQAQMICIREVDRHLADTNPPPAAGSVPAELKDADVGGSFWAGNAANGGNANHNNGNVLFKRCADIRPAGHTADYSGGRVYIDTAGLVPGGRMLVLPKDRNLLTQLGGATYPLQYGANMHPAAVDETANWWGLLQIFMRQY